MPALLARVRPAEEGWSKPHIDDMVEKLFTATFPAFKFPDRERLHVTCGVQLCREECPYVSLYFQICLLKSFTKKPLYFSFKRWIALNLTHSFWTLTRSWDELKCSTHWP